MKDLFINHLLLHIAEKLFELLAEGSEFVKKKFDLKRISFFAKNSWVHTPPEGE